MSQKSSQRKKRSSGIRSLLTILIAALLSAVLWLNHQYIVDLITVWRYEPSSEIVQITEKTTLNDSGRFIFYATQPRIDDRTTFNKECERMETGTAILGCYVDNRTYIFNVTDARLEGVKEVTAAHELLHAVYDRMAPGERSAVNKLVEAEYEKLSSETDFAKRMAFYARTEPGERDNELHSIIGTEVASISPELEAHYKKYFNNRSQIVAFHDKYDQAFNTLADQAGQLSTQLDQLNNQIKAISSQYNTDVTQLNADIAAFNRRANSGAFTTEAQFEAERQVLLARVSAISGERSRVNSLINQYNELREQYNSVATQSNDLYKSIDSSLAPTPKV